MFRTISCIAIVMALALVPSTPAPAQQWGNLRGKFVYDGAAPAPKPLDINKDLQCCTTKHVDESLVVGPDGGLANVIVYLKPAAGQKVKAHPDYDATADDEVSLDNNTCQFKPHVLAMRTSQTLVVKNSDMCSHNTNISPLGGGGINPLIGAGQDVKHKFNRQQNLPIPVNCNIHPWMSAWVLPRDNPYFAVSDADGSFEIKNLPAGADLEFQVWHESAGYVEVPGLPKGTGKTNPFKKKIQAGDNDLGTIKLKPTIFKKK